MRRRIATIGRVQLALTWLFVSWAIVSCESPVAPEANTPIGLRVWAQVVPTRLSIADSTATLRIRVYVQNAAGDSLRLMSGAPPFVFTLDPAKSRGLAESFRIASATDSLNAGPNTDYWGDSVYVFAPHEADYTEAVISWNDWRTGGWKLAPGVFRVRSYFNGREGSSASFTLVP